MTCNPSTCMLIASNGAPPPIPVPPQNNNLPDNNMNSRLNNSNPHDNDISNTADKHRYYHDKQQPFQNPAAIGLTIVCSLLLVVFICWITTRLKKKALLKTSLKKDKLQQRTQSISSTIPSTAPPSFSSAPPDMSVIRHPHARLQPQSTRSSTGSVEPLPSYLTPYSSPPKYEQAIVTQIRDLREENGGSSTAEHGTTSMWVPVYFTRQQNNFQTSVNRGEVFGFTPNHSYWLQHLDDPNINGNSGT